VISLLDSRQDGDSGCLADDHKRRYETGTSAADAVRGVGPSLSGAVDKVTLLLGYSCNDWGGVAGGHCLCGNTESC
jgi:hypothetical protein